ATRGRARWRSRAGAGRAWVESVMWVVRPPGREGWVEGRASWSGARVVDLEPDSLVPLALGLGPGHRARPHLVGGQHVGAAVGLLVQPDDVDHPERVDLAGDQVRGGADQ